MTEKSDRQKRVTDTLEQGMKEQSKPVVTKSTPFFSCDRMGMR